MSTAITKAVQDQYAATAVSSLTNRSAGVAAVAEAFGYSAQDLMSIPAEANMGLSCGNPVAMAHLKPGEVVVDLGSGGGLDVFLAAAKVGPTGRAIGIDMTPQMVARARSAAAKGPDGKPYGNVDFHLAEIDHLPLSSASVDVILSNCVINLAPDKPAVFREMYRVLKPGGRVAVSDIALKRDLPDELAHDISAYVGCIAGAIHVLDYERGLLEAGFEHVAIVDSNADLNAYAKVDGQAACCSPAEATQEVAVGSACCSRTTVSLPVASSGGASSSCCGGPASGASKKAALHDHLAELMRKYDVNEFAASVKILAVKPL